MQVELIIKQFTANSISIEKLLGNVSEENAKWKPSADKWSILEVVHHLLDEEKKDFRKRLQLTLLNKEWPHFDPVSLVVESKYNDQHFEFILSQFLDERAESLIWLQKLENPNWHSVYNHPKLGPIRAGDLLVSWLAHDLLHIRQLSNLLIVYYESTNIPFNTNYAAP